jgi:hypothetical protein
MSDRRAQGIHDARGVMGCLLTQDPRDFITAVDDAAGGSGRAGPPSSMTAPYQLEVAARRHAPPRRAE